MTEPLERILEPPIDEARIAATWKRIREPRGNRGLPRWTLGVAVAGLAASALFVWWPAHGRPLACVDRSVATSPGSVLDATTADRAVAFDDGSVVDLGAGARLQILTNEPDRFVALLDRGHVHFDVHPGGPRHWEIETSRATVEVVGTAFVVDGDARRLLVDVERGIVIVRGERVPGRIVRLTAGQHISIEDPVAIKTATAEPPRPPSPPPMRPTPRSTPPVASHPAPPVHVATSTPQVAAPPPPLHASALATAMSDADRRRADGDPAGAADVLEHALIGARGDESTGLAEFTLGRLYLERLGKPERAAEMFASMIAIGQPQGLLEDASARRIMALVQANRRDDAATALVEYDRAHPRGAHQAMVHALFAPRSP